MPIALAGGSLIFLLFLIAFIIAIAYGYYSVRGSGIGQHGWKDRDRAFGTGVGKDPTADVRTWGRGSDSSRPRRQRRMTGVEQATAEAIDGAVDDGDPAWRGRVGENVQLVAPVTPSRDHVRGPDDAEVTLAEYGEYECPYCKEALVQTRRLEERFGGALRLVFRHFPQPKVHANATTAAIAAEAAHRQGRFFELHELLGGTKKPLEPARVRELAAKAGLDLAQFDADIADPDLRRHVAEDKQSGLESGVNGTPTFFINNVRYDGDFDAEELGVAIEAARGVAADAGVEGVL